MKSQMTQARKPCRRRRPEIGHGGGPADRREAPFVLIAEGRQTLTPQPAADQLGGITPFLHGGRRHARHRLSVGVAQMRQIADYEDFGMAGQAQIGFMITRPPRSSGTPALASNTRPNDDACTRPPTAPCGTGICSVPRACLCYCYSVFADIRYLRPRPRTVTPRCRSATAACAERSGGKDERTHDPAFDQHDLGVCRIDVAKVAA